MSQAPSTSKSILDRLPPEVLNEIFACLSYHAVRPRERLSAHLKPSHGLRRVDLAVHTDTLLHSTDYLLVSKTFAAQAQPLLYRFAYLSPLNIDNFEHMITSKSSEGDQVKRLADIRYLAVDCCRRGYFEKKRIDFILSMLPKIPVTGLRWLLGWYWRAGVDTNGWPDHLAESVNTSHIKFLHLIPMARNTQAPLRRLIVRAAGTLTTLCVQERSTGPCRIFSPMPVYEATGGRL